MKPACIALALACVASTAATAADTPAKRDVVAFNASVLVEVDAAGKPVKVEAPADLPEAIRGFVEKRVASWQYLPAKLEGVPQASTTYVSVKACATPVAEGYRLGVDFNGNGPRRAGDLRLDPPMYPMLAHRAGTEATFVLILATDAAGKAQIEAIEHADISGRAGAGAFEPTLRRWAQGVRFDLEQVAGKPVPARVRVPVLFSMGLKQDRKTLREELQAKAMASRECQIAAGESGIKPIALEPAVTVIPKPAG
jgi:hypothetical protein